MPTGDFFSSASAVQHDSRPFCRMQLSHSGFENLEIRREKYILCVTNAVHTLGEVVGELCSTYLF